MVSSKKKKRAGIGCLSMVVLYFILSQTISGCVSFSTTAKEVEEFYAGYPYVPESVFYTEDNFEMHYRYLDLENDASVVFIHGTPGSWSAFMGYFRDSVYYNKVNLAAPDRPGWGKSTYSVAVPSLEEQAKLLKPMLEQIPAPRILVGHSLGGPIVARMAMDYPDLIDGIVMLAPALAPELEPHEDWFRVPMRWPIISTLVPMDFLISNEELIYLEEELDEMLPLWKGIEIPTIVIQGGEDNLVHPGNAAFADSALVNASVDIVFLEGQNHFLPWNEYDLVREKVLGLLDQIQSGK